MATLGDFSIRLWEARTGRSLRILRTSQKDSSGQLAFDPSGRHLLSFSSGTLEVWSLEDFALRKTLQLTKTGFIHSFALSPDGKWLIVTTSDDEGKYNQGFLRLLKWPTGQVFREIKRKPALRAVAFHPNSQYFASLSSNAQLLLWSVDSDAPIKALDPGIALGSRQPCEGFGPCPKGEECSGSECWSAKSFGGRSLLAFAPDEISLLSFREPLMSLHKHTLALWDLRSGRKVKELSPESVLENPFALPVEITGLTFSTRGDALLMLAKIGTIELWSCR